MVLFHVVALAVSCLVGLASAVDHQQIEAFICLLLWPVL